MAASHDTSRSRLQSLWLVVYWLGFSVTVFLLAQAVIARMAPSSVMVVAVASAAALIVCIFAVRISRHGVDDTTFIKATTTGRVITVAWLAIGIIIVVVPVVSVFTGLELGRDEWTSGFLGTVGAVSFLAAVGPGYSEYRGAVVPPAS